MVANMPASANEKQKTGFMAKGSAQELLVAASPVHSRPDDCGLREVRRECWG